MLARPYSRPLEAEAGGSLRTSKIGHACGGLQLQSQDRAAETELEAI